MMEPRYYLHDGTAQLGPFSLEELKTKNLSRETPIWHEGLGSWTHAARLEELSDCFVSGPPPFGSVPSPDRFAAEDREPQQAQEQSDRKRGLKVLLVVLLMAVLVAAGVYYANRLAAPEDTEQSYAQKVMTIEELERSRPADFLSSTTEYRENFWGDKLKIRGVITNKATVATYKDAVIRVTYYSKTKTELGSRDHTVYERFGPNTNTAFEFKTDQYQDVHSIAVALVSAVAE